MDIFSAQHYNFMAKRFRENLEPLFEAEEELRRAIWEGYTSSQLEKARLQSSTLVGFAISLARNFGQDNERFDPVKFLDACSPDAERYPLSELWDG